MESHVADIWPSCLCAVVFLLLLLWDVCKALKMRAHWAPGHALFLSALTIQMLAMIHISDISYVSSKHEMNQEVTSLLKEDQLLFDCARLMMCVFMAYLLPTMVPRFNWSRVWSDIGALLLSVMVRMAFEVYFVWKVAKPFYRIPNRRQSVWFIVSNTTLFTASLLLFFLLSCAVLAGKSIRSILPRKVHWALSCCSISNSPYSGECKNQCCSKSDFPYRGECKNPCCSRSNPPSPYFGECKNLCCSKSDFPYRGECKNPCCSTSNAPSPYSGECKNPCCSTSNAPSPYCGECKNPCCSKSDFPYRGECKNPCCSRSNTPSPYFGECKNPCCSKSDFPYRGECKNPCCSTSNAPSPYSGECKNPCCSTSNAPSPYCGECKNPCCSKSDFPYRGECKNPCCSRSNPPSPYFGECKNPCCSKSDFPYRGECKNPCCSTSNAPSPYCGECKKSCSSDTAGPCDDWCCSQYPEKCKTTEDHVLKCWIVARVSQPEYIMARSVFSSLAGVVVTIAVVVFVIKWACLHLPLDYGIAHKTTIFIELAFILVGWMAVSFRWLTAVMFFPRKAEFLFFLEDFWTMSILDLKADLDAQLTRPVYKMKKFSQRREGQKFLLNLMTAVRLHSVLLPMRVWLQMLVVWLSKACWGLSQMLTGMIRPFVMWILHGSCGRREGSKFSETLESLRMPGETAYDLWIANKMAFESTQSNMKRGIKKGEGNSAKLNKIIEHRPDELKAEDDKYFIEIRRMSLKRKGISLLYCMIHFYEESINFDAINDAVVANSISRDIKNDVTKAFETARVINKARKACSKAWDFLDFVDGSDVAADAEFHNLVNMWHKHYKNMKAVKMATEQQRNATALKNWHGSKDWMRLTVDCNLYNKLYKKFYSYDENSHPDRQELAIKKLRRRLAYLVHDCLVNQLGKVLIEKCNKWAEEGKEEEIFHAAFIAGKGKGLRDKIPECVADAG